MNIHKTKTQETIMEHGDVIVTCSEWGNGEGVNISVTHNRSILLQGILTHKEVDILMAALHASRV